MHLNRKVRPDGKGLNTTAFEPYCVTAVFSSTFPYARAV